MANLSLAFQRTSPVFLYGAEFLSIMPDGALSTTSTAVYGLEDAVLVSNAGVIFSAEQAVNFAGANGAMSNTGIISGANSAGVIELGSSSLATAGWSVTNGGTIHALGVNVPGLVIEGGGNWIINTGQIISQAANTITLGQGMSAAANTLINFGQILSSATALHSGDDPLTLQNHGTVVGDITTGAGQDLITNMGTIEGALSLGAGADRFDGRGGQVLGQIAGGTGNDYYVTTHSGTEIFEQSGAGTDTIEAHASFRLPDWVEQLTLAGVADLRGLGNDSANTLLGNSGHNVLSGRGGSDTITAGEGDDFVWAGLGTDSVSGGIGDDDLRLGGGDDTATGGEGNDMIYGRRGSDNITGGEGNDTLTGGSGSDFLSGGDDDDLLRGGSGPDTLEGGAGADIFDFNSAEESAWQSHDRIVDFQSGTDKIDLSNLISAQLDINILGSYSGGGQASLRSLVVTDGMRLLIDVDGDGTREMRIDLQGVASLSANDFIL